MFEKIKIDEIIDQRGIHCLPAEDGDCIFVQLPDGNNVFRMLIDSGTPNVWNEVLEELLISLKKRGILIDVLVITHIDNDHIGGAISLFQDNDLCKIIKEVWYNGLNQILGSNLSKIEVSKKQKEIYKTLISERLFSFGNYNEEISAKQGLSFSQLLKKQNIPVNKFTFGKSICDNTPTLSISRNIKIDFLGPRRQDLNSLLRVFKKELNKIKMGTEIKICNESEEAFEVALLNQLNDNIEIKNISAKRPNIKDIEKWASDNCKEDTSKTNLSSIAFCIRYYNKKFLFLADINANLLIENIIKLKTQLKDDLVFDVIKIPHHASKSNCLKLLNILDSKSYIISTNGIKHNHPNKECIAKIITRPNKLNINRCIYFNYKNDIYELFNNEDLKRIYKYDCVFSYNVLLLEGN